AAEAAKILGVELRPLIVRKIGAPGNPEFAAGAAAEIPGSQQVAVWWNENTLKWWKLNETWQRQQILAKKLEISEYSRKIGISQKLKRQRQKSGNIVLIDEGAATGGTMMAAIGAVRKIKKGLALQRKARPYQITVALPVASTEAAEMLKKNADEVVILHIDQYLGAVGAYYRKFEQVSWEKVKQLLKSSYGTNEKIN
ncbi:MAG: hypothetical protein U0946_02960, partial [Patescibacteria group bacterium]|nr:hypothetical protein [Patescibacteria group bacterium]